MDWIDAVNLVASAFSLALAVVAIWLSFVFYRFSRDAEERSNTNAAAITAGVSRLEKIFDGLYSDTFTMMKETVTDMRQHIWRRGDDAVPTVSETAEPDPLLAEILAKVEATSRDIGIAGNQIAELRKRIEPSVKATVEEAATRPASLRTRVLQLLSMRTRQGRTLTVSELLERLSRRGPVNTAELVDVVFDLRDAGLIEWSGPPTQLTDGSAIRYVPREERDSRSAKVDHEEPAGAEEPPSR